MTKTEADDHERARADNQNVRRGTTTTRGLAPTTRTSAGGRRPREGSRRQPELKNGMLQCCVEKRNDRTRHGGVGIGNKQECAWNK
jgi:hypothetical protein